MSRGSKICLVLAAVGLVAAGFCTGIWVGRGLTANFARDGSGGGEDSRELARVRKEQPSWKERVSGQIEERPHAVKPAEVGKGGSIGEKSAPAQPVAGTLNSDTAVGGPSSAPPEIQSPPVVSPPPRECICPPVQECPSCPPPEVVCREYVARLNDLTRRLSEAEEIASKRGRANPREIYPAPTAAERRAMAALDDNLMLEMPTLGEDLMLSDQQAVKFKLTPEERQQLEQMYREFHKSLFDDLRRIYAEMVGDPDAGADATLAALIHNIINLAPRQSCRESMLTLVAALASGEPLPPVSPDASQCELVARLVFSAVDRLEAEVRGSLDQKGLDALWAGTSSFNFSVDPDGE